MQAGNTDEVVDQVTGVRGVDPYLTPERRPNLAGMMFFPESVGYGTPQPILDVPVLRFD